MGSATANAAKSGGHECPSSECEPERPAYMRRQLRFCGVINSECRKACNAVSVIPKTPSISAVETVTVDVIEEAAPGLITITEFEETQET
jgi:hypothetical protein